MKKKISKIIILLIIFFIIWAVIHYFDYIKDSLITIKKNFSFIDIVILLILSISLYLDDTLRLFIYFKQIYPKIKFLKLYHTITCSFVFHYGLPINLGIPIRIILLKKVMKIAYTNSSAIILFDTFLGYCLTLLFCIIGSIIFFFNFFSTATYVIAIAILLVTVIFVFVIFKFKISNNKYNKYKWYTFLKNKLIIIKDIFRKISLKLILINAFLFFLTLVIFAIRFKFIILIFNRYISLSNAFFIHTTSLLISFLSMVPLGLGVKETTSVILLSKLGIPQTISIPTTIIERIFTTGFGFILGLISIQLIGYNKIKNFIRKKGKDK